MNLGIPDFTCFVIAVVFVMEICKDSVTVRAAPVSMQSDELALNQEPQSVRGQLYRALEMRLVDGFATSSYRRHSTTQTKRNCKYNLGLSHDCDYRDAAQAALRRRYVQSGLSPGK